MTAARLGLRLQVEELLTAVEAMRRRPHDTDEMCHGWRLMYTLRGPGASSRGDMAVVDPIDGQKIFSMVGLQRKLNGDEDHWDAAMKKARAAVALANGEDPNDLENRKRRRQVNVLVDSLSAHEDRMFANMLPILLLQHGPTSYWEREAR